MRIVTQKQYELSNHLGNVLNTVYDRRTPIVSSGTTISYYQADVVFAADYYPFGSGENWTKTGGSKDGRYYQWRSYRYGFNKQEKDGELGEYYSFEYRVHDARLGRFLSVDLIHNQYPWQSTYAYFRNSPIKMLDYLGLGGPRFRDQPGDDGGTYTYVFQGNCPYSIALANHITLDELAKLNPEIFLNYSSNNANYWSYSNRANWMIHPGDWLKIRKSEFEESPSTPSLSQEYVDVLKRSTIPFAAGTYSDRTNQSVNTITPGVGGIAADLSSSVRHMFPFLNPRPSIFADFMQGIGPENTVFTDQSALTKRVRTEITAVDKLRDYMYKKYSNLGYFSSGASVTNYAPYRKSHNLFQFIPTDEPLNSIGQFIGDFSGDIFLSKDGKSLIFVITDSKSMASLLYRLGGSHSRSEGLKNGNTYQKYVWSEPVDWEKFNKNKNK